MLSLLRLIPWPDLFLQSQQTEEGAAAPTEPDPETSPEADLEAGSDGAGTDVTDGVMPEDLEPVFEPPQVEIPQRSADPIEAITDTAETATEAATEFVSWIGSGQRDALIAVALVISFTTLQWLLRWTILRGIVSLPRQDDYSIPALVQRIVSRFHMLFMLALALVMTDALRPLPESISGGVKIFFVLTAVLQVAVLVQEFAVSSVRRSVHRSAGDSVALASAFNIIKWFISFAVWSIAALLILSNIGTDVTALLAGLGIGGIAIGFAAQGVFRDVFSSISIIMDKPFQIGDTIRYGDSWGAIEEIGLKTTRIRARSGEQLVISNTNLLEYEIHNMQRMARRRIETGFGVVYQTDPELAERIPEIVADLVKNVRGVEFDRCGMSSFGPSSLDYDLVFFSLHPDYNRSMAARSRVLLALFQAFKEQNIEFAYPTQTLLIEGFGNSSAVSENS